MIRLYIIDDHHLIIKGLYSSFDLESDDFELVGGSTTIEHAMENIAVKDVDIIILDLYIKQSNPVSNFSRVHNAFPLIPIVILSQEDSLLWKLAMFQLGAKSYISKGESVPRICLKLTQVAQGEIVIPSEVSKILYYKDRNNKSLCTISGYLEIISGLDRGMSKKEIAKKMNESCSSIEKKLQKIRACFEVNTNIALIKKATE